MSKRESKEDEKISDISKAITEGVYRAYEKKLVSQIKKNDVPHHIAIIMDGNRRFAEKMGLEPSAGHVMGREKLEKVLEWCLELGIRVLTVYAFSTENLKRSKKELEALMDLFEENFRRVAEDERIHKNRIRVRAVGQLDELPQNVRESIRYAEERTKEYDEYFFNIAVAYGGREEIIQAIKRIANDAKDEKLDPDEIDEDLVSNYLYTKDFPDPDLILRTSGEERISNFLLWQVAYSELYFADVYWPDMRKMDFLRAIRSYQKRRRRFGS